MGRAGYTRPTLSRGIRGNALTNGQNRPEPTWTCDRCTTPGRREAAGTDRMHASGDRRSGWDRPIPGVSYRSTGEYALLGTCRHRDRDVPNRRASGRAIRPLGHGVTRRGSWSRGRESNPWPAVYKTAALPTELPRRGARSVGRPPAGGLAAVHKRCGATRSPPRWDAGARGRGDGQRQSGQRPRKVTSTRSTAYPWRRPAGSDGVSTDTSRTLPHASQTR